MADVPPTATLTAPSTETLTLRPSRSRAPIVFWTALGAAGIAVSLTSLLRPVIQVRGHPFPLGPWPLPGIAGLLLVLYMQLAYAAWLRLTLDGDGIAFRNLLGTRRVPWSALTAIDTVSALTPAGRGGNMNGLFLRASPHDLLVPDVFTLRRDALRALLLDRARAAASKNAPG